MFMFINRWPLRLTFNQGKICKHFTVHCAFNSVFSSISENAGQYPLGVLFVCLFCLFFFFLNFVLEFGSLSCCGFFFFWDCHSEFRVRGAIKSCGCLTISLGYCSWAEQMLGLKHILSWKHWEKENPSLRMLFLLFLPVQIYILFLTGASYAFGLHLLVPFKSSCGCIKVFFIAGNSFSLKMIK